MNFDIEINVFKKFACLENPFECARFTAKQDILVALEKQIYVGRTDAGKLDGFVRQKSSTTSCLREAETSFQLLKFDTAFEKNSTDDFCQIGNFSQLPKPVKSGSRVRSVSENHGKWNSYIGQCRKDKALNSDAANPLLPTCFGWNTNDVISWLQGIGMEKYKETFLANNVDGSLLCSLDMNRLVKMGVHAWDDLKIISKELKILSKRPIRIWFYRRDIILPPMDDVDLYLEFKNVHGERSEMTSFSQFTKENKATLWSYPEKTLHFPGMISRTTQRKKMNKKFFD